MRSKFKIRMKNKIMRVIINVRMIGKKNDINEDIVDNHEKEFDKKNNEKKYFEKNQNYYRR